MNDATKCEYCDALNGGHTMACQARHLDGQKPKQIPAFFKVAPSQTPVCPKCHFEIPHHRIEAYREDGIFTLRCSCSCGAYFVVNPNV